MKRYSFRICTAALIFVAVGRANASVSAGVDVTDFRVVLTALAPGAAPSVSFAGAGGSDAIGGSYSGSAASNQFVDVSSSVAFGAISAATAPDPLAGGSASLIGDVFGAGASGSTTAYASSQASRSIGESQVGLVNDVEIAYFILAPDTRMTISAYVTAWATATGASSTEYADGGMLMEIGDQNGAGPLAASSFLGTGANIGSRSDFESGIVSVTYSNDTDAAIIGTFSGNIESYASSGGGISVVPEPMTLSLMLAGVAAAAALSRWRKRH